MLVLCAVLLYLIRWSHKPVKYVIQYQFISKSLWLLKHCSTDKDTGSVLKLNLKTCTRGLQRDVVYLCWPIAAQYESKRRGEGGSFTGSQPMSIVVHRSPNKLWKSNSIFKLWHVPQSTYFYKRWNRVSVFAHSAGAYTATLLVMVNVMKGDGRTPPTFTSPG